MKKRREEEKSLQYNLTGGSHYRCMFTSLQLASVLQHGVDHIPCACSLSVCWGHVQEVLYAIASIMKEKADLSPLKQAKANVF